MTPVRPKLGPRGVVVVGVVFTSLSSIFVRLSDAPALAIAAWRMIFTSALLLPLFISRRVARHDESVSAETPLPLGAALVLSVASGILLALHFGLWITSLSYTTVASSTVLVTTHPIMVALLGLVVLGERLSFRGVLYMLVALGGSVVLVWGGIRTGGQASFGNLLAFLGAVTISGYMLIGRIVRRRLGVNDYTMIVYSVAAVLLVLAALLRGVALVPYSMRDFILFAALALFCTLLGHSLFSWALKYVRPTLVSTSILGEPVIASALAVVLFGERPALTTLIGGAVILVSIYLFIREEGRTARAARLQVPPEV